MASSRKNLKRVAPHNPGRKGVKCAKCKKRHKTSEHWSHKVAHRKNWFGKAARPFGPKKRAKKRAGKSGSATPRKMTRAQKSALNKARFAALRARRAKSVKRAAPKRAAKRTTRRKTTKRKQHRVRPHLAANAGPKPGQHEARGHLAAMPKKRRAKKTIRRGRRRATATQLLPAGRLPASWKGEKPDVVILQRPRDRKKIVVATAPTRKGKRMKFSSLPRTRFSS